MDQRQSVSQKEEDKQSEQRKKKSTSLTRQTDSTPRRDEELHVVLLGHDDTVRISAGNFILGSVAFDTGQRAAQCVKREGEVLGRKITVVSAPGWSKLACVEDTPELTKQEIVLSTYHCSPGPHIVLLVTNLEDEKTDQEHVELLGEGIWEHTIVVLTSQKYVPKETQRSALLIKCDKRFFIFENNNSQDREQFGTLIKQMETLVLRNQMKHYEIDRATIQQLLEKRELEEEEVGVRKMSVFKQRNTLQYIRDGMPGAISEPSELKIVVVGSRGSGKTSAVNTILQTEESYIWPTTRCSKHVGMVGGKMVTLVDTPGFGHRALVEYNAPEMISYNLDSLSPTAYILVIQLDVSFSSDNRESAEKFVNDLGKAAWKRTIVLFTHGEWLGDTPLEQYIESEGSALIWVVQKCQNRYHVLSNKKPTNTEQVTQLIEKIDEMAYMAAMNSGTESEDSDKEVLLDEGVERESWTSEEPEPDSIGIREVPCTDDRGNGEPNFTGIREEPSADDWMLEVPSAVDRVMERADTQSMISPPSMASTDVYSLRSVPSIGSADWPPPWGPPRRRPRRSHSSDSSLKKSHKTDKSLRLTTRSVDSLNSLDKCVQNALLDSVTMEYTTNNLRDDREVDRASAESMDTRSDFTGGSCGSIPFAFRDFEDEA